SIDANEMLEVAVRLPLPAKAGTANAAATRMATTAAGYVPNPLRIRRSPSGAAPKGARRVQQEWGAELAVPWNLTGGATPTPSLCCVSFGASTEASPDLFPL